MKKLICFCFITLLSIPLFSQQAENLIYVTNLQAQTTEDSIVLTWEDSDLLSEGSYIIYRNQSAIKSENFAQAVPIGRSRIGIETFTTKPRNITPYYYAVIAQSSEGTNYTSYIDDGNTLLSPVGIETVSPLSSVISNPTPTVTRGSTASVTTSPTPAVTTGSTASVTTSPTPTVTTGSTASVTTSPIPAETTSPTTSTIISPIPTESASLEVIKAEISGINTLRINSSIIVRFTCSNEDSRIFIYRSTKPIQTMADLNVITPIGTTSGLSCSWEDNPLPGIEYYYAAVDPLKINNPDFQFSLGIDSTQEPIKLPISSFRTETSEQSAPRTSALPLLLLTNEIESGNALVIRQPLLPERKTLSEETRETINSILRKLPQEENPLREPQFINENEESAEDRLYSILQDSFIPKDWQLAESQLKNYLDNLPSLEQAAKAHFYLGQVYYFLGKYRNAFMEMLLCQDSYPEEIIPWQQLILSILSETEL